MVDLWSLIKLKTHYITFCLLFTLIGGRFVDFVKLWYSLQLTVTLIGGYILFAADLFWHCTDKLQWQSSIVLVGGDFDFCKLDDCSSNTLFKFSKIVQFADTQCIGERRNLILELFKTPYAHYLISHLYILIIDLLKQTNKRPNTTNKQEWLKAKKAHTNK